MVPHFGSEKTEKDLYGSRNLYELRTDQIHCLQKGQEKAREVLDFIWRKG